MKYELPERFRKQLISVFGQGGPVGLKTGMMGNENIKMVVVLTRKRNFQKSSIDSIVVREGQNLQRKSVEGPKNDLCH